MPKDVRCAPRSSRMALFTESSPCPPVFPRYAGRVAPRGLQIITNVIITIVMKSATPSRFLGFRFGKLAQCAQRLAFSRESTGLDARHIGVLMIAASMKDRSQQAIGELLDIDRTTMVRLAGELETSGYLALWRSAC